MSVDRAHEAGTLRLAGVRDPLRVEGRAVGLAADRPIVLLVRGVEVVAARPRPLCLAVALSLRDRHAAARVVF